jgi:hypothetical protein
VEAGGPRRASGAEAIPYIISVAVMGTGARVLHSNRYTSMRERS